MKTAFLKMTKVDNEEQAMRGSILAALQRNLTYQDNASDEDRMSFRNTLASCLREHAANYRETVSDDIHVQNIANISDRMTDQHGNMLAGSRLRFGTAQKAFNLYLKFLWCLDQERAIPPHCPVDGIVLGKAGIDGCWTKLDSVDLYMNWVHQIREVARKDGFGSIQEWELAIWNTSS